MKQLIIITLIALFSIIRAKAQSNVGVNNPNPDVSAALMVDTTTAGPKGMLIPRMTQVRRNAIPTPATGLMIYQTDNTPGFYYYNGSAWVGLGVAATVYPNVELNVANSSAQAISAVTGSGSYQTLSFSATNNANASLTNGNSWNGNTFTVGSGGAGWYQLGMQLIGVGTNGSNTSSASTIDAVVFLDKNNAITNSPANISSNTANTIYPYASGNYVINSSSTYIKNVTYLNTIIYLQSGDFLNLRAQSASTSVAANISTDGSSNLTIVRIK